MTRGPSLSAAAVLLLGAAMLPGCSYDPDAAARTEAQSQRAAPAHGGIVVHLGGAVASEATVAH